MMMGTDEVLRSQPRRSDRAAVAKLLRATGFFHEPEVAIGVELVDETQARGADAGYLFLFADAEPGRLRGYSCFGPIPLTDGSWDLYWIAVDPELQGGGLGRRLLESSERTIRAAGGQRLFVDTSGRPAYAPTRAFYERCGYQAVARLVDFYAAGDDKVIFRRDLEGETVEATAHGDSGPS